MDHIYDAVLQLERLVFDVQHAGNDLRFVSGKIFCCTNLPTTREMKSMQPQPLLPVCVLPREIFFSDTNDEIFRHRHVDFHPKTRGNNMLDIGFFSLLIAL